MAPISALKSLRVVGTRRISTPSACPARLKAGWEVRGTTKFGLSMPLVARAQSRAVWTARKMLSEPPEVKVPAASSGALISDRPKSTTSFSSFAQRGECALAEAVLGPERRIGALLHVGQFVVEIVVVNGHPAVPPRIVVFLGVVQPSLDFRPGQPLFGQFHRIPPPPIRVLPRKCLPPITRRPERCQSGRSGRSRKPLCVQAYRGFESHPLRHYPIRPLNDAPGCCSLNSRPGLASSGRRVSAACRRWPGRHARRRRLPRSLPRNRPTYPSTAR